MRTLNLNKRPIWHVRFIGEKKLKDEDGYLTGEIIKEYSVPKLIHLNLYTSTSEIIEQMFGSTNNINIICSDESVELIKGDKFFYNEPDDTIDIETDFDLELSAISESLNHWNYGFRRMK